MRRSDETVPEVAQRVGQAQARGLVADQARVVADRAQYPAGHVHEGVAVADLHEVHPVGRDQGHDERGSVCR